MKYEIIKAYDCADAWYKTVKAVYTEGDKYIVGVGSEPSLTKKLNVSVVIEHPENRPLIDDNAPVDMKYVGDYALKYLYLDKEQALDDSTYTYGDRLRHPTDQIQGIIDKYTKSLDNRQCTMVTRFPNDMYLDDPPCLTVVDTEVYLNKLHMTCYFRSWDVYGGMCANIAGLQLLNETIVDEINSNCGYHMTTGKLILHSKNAHVYERQFPLVESLLHKSKERYAVDLYGK